MEAGTKKANDLFIQPLNHNDRIKSMYLLKLLLFLTKLQTTPVGVRCWQIPDNHQLQEEPKETQQTKKDE